MIVVPCGCPPPAPETFWTLLHDLAHWEFEIFLMAVFDGLIGAGIIGFCWPRIKKHWHHHLERDKAEGKNGN